MSLNKKEKAELIKVYDTWWHSYLNGDVKTYDSFLADDFRFVGSTGGEEFLNKKDTTQFFAKTADQLAGKAELRNLKRTVEPINELVLITDLADAYILSDGEWVFYSKFRFSSLLRKEKDGWKFIYQHFSAPDAKAQEGETLGLEKITKENFELRDAIKRRTVDLEQKNRELEIESALERVRSRAMAMQDSNELAQLVDTVQKELTKLDFSLTMCIINIIDENDRSNNVWATNPETGKDPEMYYLKFEDYPFHHGMWKAWKARKNRWVYTIEGSEKEIYDEYLFNETEFKRFPKKTQKDFRALEKYVASFTFSNFGGLQTVGDQPLSEDSLHILARFGKVFDLTYTRFNDLKQAEAQAREAQIEAALERVRAKTMAMKHSDELPEAANVLFLEVQGLGIPAWSAGYNIMAEDKKSSTASMSSEGVLQPPFQLPFTEHVSFKPWLTAIKKGVTFFTQELAGKDIEDHYKYMLSLPDVTEMIDEIAEAGFPLPTYQINHISFFKQGFLLFITYESVPEAHDIFKRFTKVFEQTYTRFLDLQKAEAQAREAEIELALERVRARTMAMQQSKELADVATVLFQQVKELGIPQWTCGFNIWEIGDKDITFYPGGPDGEILPSCKIPLMEHPIFKQLDDSRRRGDELFVYEKKGEIQADHYRYMHSLPGIGDMLQGMLDKGLEFPSFQIDHVANFSYGNILFITYEPFPEMHDVFIRFAKVFEQTYTRFLDLKKAEAQAREALIEASLERVRARTMAMHRGDELADTSTVLFDQVKKLGIKPRSCGFLIMNNETKSMEDWSSNADEHGNATLVTGNLSYDQHPIISGVVASWKRGDPYFIEEIHGEDLQKYYQAVTSKETTSKAIKDKVLAKATSEYTNSFYFKYGMMYVLTPEPLKENEISIMLRFASVFELTYRRFLDLEKAETQAKKAQIEAALERVRSRSMAMHKSEELKDVIQVVYEQFNQLNIFIEHAGFIIDYKERDDMYIWLADQHGVPSQVTIPYFDTAHWNSFNEAKEKGINFFANHLDFKEKNRFYQKLIEYIPELPEKARKFYLNCPGLAISTVLLENVGLYIENFSGIPYSEKENNTLMRFGKVFQQTYTRFQDLQKAEAQAREAQIEAAIERVRSKSMAMHKSDELLNVIKVVSGQLVELDIKFDNVSFGQNNLEHDYNFWVSIAGYPEPVQIHVPYIDTPVLGSLIEAYKNDVSFLTNTFTVEENKVWSQHMAKHVDFSFLSKAARNHIQNSSFTRSSAILPNIQLFVGKYEATPYSDDENKIIARFAQVFEQSYTRFLDLQKAEEQAREAQIEASLERVRSKTMAMHNSKDVGDTVVALFNEVLNLGLDKSIRCGIGILEGNEGMETWSANILPDGEFKLRMGMLDMTIHPLLMGLKKAWKKGETGFTYKLIGKDVIRYYNALNNEPEYPFNIELDTLPEKVFHNSFFFSEGILFAFTSNPVSEEAAKVLKRFTSVFEQTYTRFLDLQKAEAQAKEAQIGVALERVRSRTLAMHESGELSETAVVLFRQLIDLGIEPNRLFITIIKDDGLMEFWITNEDGSKVIDKFTGSSRENRTFKRMLEGWNEKKKSLHIDLKGKELQDYFKYLSSLNVPFLQGLNQKRRVQILAYFSQGFIGIASPEPLTDETTALLERFAAVFNLTYTRFNDLKIAEAQSHKANIEVALEKVRARALAMQQPEELKEVAQVLRHEMGALGIEELETCSIYINDEQANKAECWYAIKDVRKRKKHLISDHFALDLNDTWVGHEMLKFYNTDDNKVSIVMRGKNRKEWIRYCEEKSVPFRGYYGDAIPDRTYHLYKFSHGSVGVATAGDISVENWGLLKRTATVFSLAYSRFKDLTQARTDLQQLKEEKFRAETALGELKATQSQLIQSEKMASLGELTAGIAHEIQNPLNFVNNFSELSEELLEELKEEIKGNSDEIVKEIFTDLEQNLNKINHHGKRASSIVKGMLDHSRTSSGIKELTDINALADEFLRLSYHGLRAKDKSFNAKFETDFDKAIPKIEIIAQDIGRVILNLINNAFYAVNKKEKEKIKGYKPTVNLITKKKDNSIEIIVKDNGTGISKKNSEKIFQPFFTTKPTGEGTGLGLSLAYDIIKKGHGGELIVDSKKGVYTQFKIVLPIKN